MTMFNKDLILQLLENRDGRALLTFWRGRNAVDIAALLESVDDAARQAAVFRTLPKDLAADVFSYLPGPTQARLARSFADGELQQLFDALHLDDAADFLEELPANLVTRVLQAASPQRRMAVNALLSYPSGSAGSVMTPEFVSLRPEDTVRQALDTIRRTGIHKETIYTCYVLDCRRLLGTVSAKDLLTAAEDAAVRDLMTAEVISVGTLTDREAAARLLAKYDLLALPVLDGEARMVGIVTVDDAIDVLTEETTEDLSIMAAVTPDEKPYFAASAWEHARHRILWLLILMLSATITGSIITRYEDAISAVPLLVAFLPMLMDTGGNCGSQSATLVIRGLALDEIQPRDVIRVVRKEFAVSLIVSAALAAANGLRIFLQYHDAAIALVISLSLVATVILSKLVGCVLPIAARQLRMDPAIMASPLITTIVDAGAVLIYFQAATAFLPLSV
ncbi:magnesium transporter [uncultured Oscillibacter sp.]|uniref:magnesium transporter n=1 Tax=uncultured Oscillibacter sp. TaxID=876091 RepID=UPI0026000F7D|nr:magnesium transporter [uncultured Oscillibacter sp.]